MTPKNSQFSLRRQRNQMRLKMRNLRMELATCGGNKLCLSLFVLLDFSKTLKNDFFWPNKLHWHNSPRPHGYRKQPDRRNRWCGIW